MAIKKTKQQKLIKNIRRAFGLAWQTDKKLVTWFIFLTAIGALLPIGISYSFKLLIDELVGIQSAAGIVTIALLSFFAFRYILELIDDLQTSVQYQYLERILKYKMENYLTYRFTEKISGLDIAHFANSETQNLIQKAGDGFYWRIPNFINFLFYSLYSIAALAGSIFVLIPFGFWIPLAMIASTIPRLFLRNKYGKIQWSLFNENVPESKDLWYLKGLLSDPQDIKEIRVFQATKELLKRLKKLQDYLFEATRKTLNGYFRSYYWPMALELGILALLTYIKLPLTAASIITVGSFTFYIQNLSRISNNSRDLIRYMADLYENNLYVGFYFDVLNLPKLIKEKEPGHAFEEVKPPRIEFQNVSFSYPDGPEVLKNISFKLEPGEHLAIVGPNGAGKTTLIKLLLRFYDPTKGSIMVDDYDLKEIKIENWYKFISTLFQDFVKFNLTIRDNIILGKPKVVDEAKVREAARKSGAEEFINKLPKKYNQRLGRRFEDSAELSIGQWQKLALARAFYEESPILILDEPTSSIDAEAEAKIFENLDKLYNNKTLVIISHRFSTVRNTDKIIVLKTGKIAEEGNHESLMSQKGIYATMFKKQAKGYVE